MKHIRWQIVLGVMLVVLSGLFYFIHYLIFHDPHHIFIYMVGDVAFVPIEVLLVTLIIHKVLSQREKRSRLEKLNMVIGVFFSETGTHLLTYFSDFDPHLDRVRDDLAVTNAWTDEVFAAKSRKLRTYDYSVEIEKVNLKELQEFLIMKRNFLLRLLENPNLLEHESFTDLLRAVFHLAEELESRKEIMDLPTSDYKHIAGDIRRAYVLLVHEWLDYMQHLKKDYPYLFSLAVRLNPFDLEASPVVT